MGVSWLDNKIAIGYIDGQVVKPKYGWIYVLCKTCVIYVGGSKSLCNGLRVWASKKHTVITPQNTIQ